MRNAPNEYKILLLLSFVASILGSISFWKSSDEKAKSFALNVLADEPSHCIAAMDRDFANSTPVARTLHANTVTDILNSCLNQGLGCINDALNNALDVRRDEIQACETKHTQYQNALRNDSYHLSIGSNAFLIAGFLCLGLALIGRYHYLRRPSHKLTVHGYDNNQPTELEKLLQECEDLELTE